MPLLAFSFCLSRFYFKLASAQFASVRSGSHWLGNRETVGGVNYWYKYFFFNKHCLAIRA